MFTRRLLAFVALVVLLLVPATTAAWTPDPDKVWKPSTIRYHAVDAKTRPLVIQAATAWNRSGAKLKLVHSPRRTAKIVVMAPMGAQQGHCWGVSRTVSVNRVRRSNSIRWTPCRTDLESVRLLAHEIGHSIGLEHELKKCALMNTHAINGVPNRCTNDRNLRPWKVYCAILEADDVRGVVKRYGGKARITKQRVCDRGPAPATPGGLTATVQDAGMPNEVVRISWVNAPAPGVRTRLFIQRDTCQTDPDATVELNYELESPAGQTNEKMFQGSTSPGTWCASMWALDQWGQPSSSPATVTFSTTRL